MNRATQKVMFSSKSGDWETPKPFFHRLHRMYGFTTDVGASAQNHLCEDYLGLDNGRPALTSEWGTVNFSNPPYGRRLGTWIVKAIRESQKGKIVVLLLPARTDTKWFEELLVEAALVTVVTGRIQFLLNGKPILDKKGHPTSAPFPSIVVTLDWKLRGSRLLSTMKAVDQKNDT